MSYNGKYKKEKTDSYKISRSKIENFLKCPHCFYIDRVLGVSQPSGFPFNLNSAVDYLLKKEFDIHRKNKTAHPLMKNYGIDAIPYQNNLLDVWRENFVGIQALHKQTNLLVFGAIDDIWINQNGELIVVDYKATSKIGDVNLSADWQISYKRQVEIYQWLLRQNGYKVSNTAYFVYCNGKRDLEAFDGKLEFDIKIIPHDGDDGWVEGTLSQIKECLDSDTIPEYSEDCDYCKYQQKLKIIN